MPASALLKFVQGATVGGDGRGLVGVLTTSVTLSNVNNANVQSWQINLVYVDPTSALTISTPYAFNDSSSTPTASFTPDVRRSYRWELKVWSVPNRAGEPDSIDIRVFTVRELNGTIVPPSQVWPPPLPDPRSGELNAKPNEMNFDGQIEGWHGTGSDGLLSQVLAKHLPPLPGNPGDVLTVSGGRWVSAPPTGGGSGDVTGPGVSVDNNIVLWNGTGGDTLKDSGLSLSAFIRHNGSVAFTGNQSMGGFKLTNNANGTSAQDLVTVAQLQSAINGLDPKGNVRAYTTTNIAALSGLGALTGSGVASFTDNQRIALGGQTTATQNGIWVVHDGAWTRPTDFATGMDVSGAYFIVEEGTFADREFLVTSDTGSAVVDTNNLTLQDFGSSTISAGNGLQKSGNTLSILHDGSTLSSSGSGLKIATGGVTGTELAVGAVDLASNKVTGLLPFTNIANGSANSVFGRAVGTTGVMASIAASADGQVLRMASGSLAFGAVDLADADAVTGLLPFANMASLTGLSVLGRATNTLGVMAAITAANDGEVLQRSGTSLVFASIATAGLADNSVTMAKLADLAGLSVIGRSVNTTGDPAAITATATGQVLRYAGTTLAFGALDLSDADAVANQLPGSYVIPDFVAQTVITTGSYRAGTNPSTNGAYNLANATQISGRNAANSADKTLLRIDSSDTVQVGDINATGIRMTTAGVIGFRIAGNDVATMVAAQMNLLVPLIEFAVGVGASTIGIAADATAAVTGAGFTARGQDVTGTGATVGGLTRVRGGNSTNGVGGVLSLRTGTGLTATQAGDFSAEIGTTPFLVYPGTVVPAGTGILRAHHNATVIAGRNQANNANRNILRWGTTANDLLVVGDTTHDASVMGDTVTLGNVADTWITIAGPTNLVTIGVGGTAQAVIGATFMSIGTNPASVGKFRLPNGDAAGDGVYIRNQANSADLRVLSVNASDSVIFGNSAGASVLAVANASLTLRPAGTDRVQITDTVFEWRMTTVRFDTAVTNPVIQQEDDATAGVTGDVLSILGQDVTGTGSTIGGTLSARAGNSTNGTGGPIDIRSGAGLTATQAGAFTLRVGGTIFLNWPGTSAPAAQGNLRLPTAGAIYARNNANTGDIAVLLTNSSDAVFVGDLTNSSSLSLQTSGARLIIGTNIEIQNSSQFRFDVAVASPSIIHEADSAAAATGDLFLVQAQSVTGTGITVGGVFSARGGDSTNGTGGALDLRSGAGVNATSAGVVQMRIGATIIFNYPGTVIPASDGAAILRTYHSSTVLSGRDFANAANASLLRWGSTANDVLTVGSSSYATEVLGSNVEIGDGSTYLELAVLATNREILSILLGADLTTTEMPANTGDKVAYWAFSTTLATANPVGGYIFESDSTGFYVRSPNGTITQLAVN